MPLQPKEEVVVNRLYTQLLRIPAVAKLGTSLKCIIKYAMILTRGQRAGVKVYLRQQKLALQAYLLGKLKVRGARLNYQKSIKELKFGNLSSKLSLLRNPLNAWNAVGEILGDPDCQPALEKLIEDMGVKKQINLPEFDDTFSTISDMHAAAHYELKQLERALDANTYIENTIKGAISTLDSYLSILDAVDAALAVAE